MAGDTTLTGAGSLGDLSLSGTYAPSNGGSALVALNSLIPTSTALLQMRSAG